MKKILLLSLIAFMVLLSGCGQKQDQKNQEPVECLEGSEICFDQIIDFGQEVSLDFRLRDYADMAKKINGKASFKVNEFSTLAKIGELEAKGDRTFYSAVYEAVGASSNKQSETIHPANFYEIGQDPAPQLILIIDGQEQYTSEFYENLYQEKGLEKPEDMSLENNDEQTLTAVWYADKDVETILAIKYVDEYGHDRYIKVNK